MSTLIVVGGYAPESLSSSFPTYDKVIAADSGYDSSKRLSITPDYVIGDFDSTIYKDEILSLGYKAYPRDKDFTDAELALKLVEGDYDILGGGEGRIDHLFALVSLFEHYGYPKRWFMRSDTLISLKGKYRIHLKKDTELSFFSPYGSVITTSGLVWDMKEHELNLGFVSLSNRMKEDSASVESIGTTLMRIDPEDYRENVAAVFNTFDLC